jgi:hypothetical protein
MKPLSPLLCLAVLAATIVAPQPARADEGVRAVVELFTSQGCSSCPPADALLADLAKRPGVLALSEHVDYWDYLGWKDPFASRVTTDRQRAYAREFALKYVYTPQLVINGKAEMPGADRDAILADVARLDRPLPVSVAIGSAADGSLIAIIGAGVAPPQGATAVIWLFVIEPRARTAVTRGENRGRTLDNVNVVREIRQLGVWRGAAENVALPRSPQPTLACAVVVQISGGGAVIGAANRETCPD